MSPGVVVAFHADIILARHAIPANKRPLKRAVKNIHQSHHTSRSGKCAFAVCGEGTRDEAQRTSAWEARAVVGTILRFWLLCRGAVKVMK